MRPNISSQSSGQALSEYALIGALVAVVSIGALLTLGQSFKNVFTGLLPQPSPILASASNGGSASPNPSGTNEMPASSIGIVPQVTTKQPPSSGISVTLSNGSQISLSAYPTDVPKSVQTMGANGTTDVLADSIQTVAQQALAAGEINQAQYNQLAALANQGHVLGDVAGLYESVAQSKSGHAFESTTITFQGKQMTIFELKDLVGVQNYKYNGVLPANPLNTPANSELQKFNTLYKQIAASGALSDPAIQAVVSTAATNIASINVALDQSGSDLSGNSIQSSQLNSNISSLLTHQNSASICTAGKGKDSGVQCAL